MSVGTLPGRNIRFLDPELSDSILSMRELDRSVGAHVPNHNLVLARRKSNPPKKWRVAARPSKKHGSPTCKAERAGLDRL